MQFIADLIKYFPVGYPFFQIIRVQINALLTKF